MNTTINCKQASSNIEQLLKYQKDPHQKEARLGAWRFSQNLYYVSSTSKIEKLWFDFLKLIKLIIVDRESPIFKKVIDNSKIKFNQLEFEFNKNEHDRVQNLEKKEKAQQKQIVNFTQALEIANTNLSLLSKNKETQIEELNKIHKMAIENLEKEIKNEQQKLQMRTNEFQKTQHNLEELRKLNDQMCAKLHHLTEEGVKTNASKNNQVNDLKEELKQKNSELSKQEETLKKIKAEFNEFKDKNHLLVSQKDSLMIEKKQIEDKLAETSQNLYKISQEKQQEIIKLTNVIQKQKVEMEVLHKQNIDLENDIKIFNEQVNQLTQEVNESHEKINNLLPLQNYNALLLETHQKDIQKINNLENELKALKINPLSSEKGVVLPQENSQKLRSPEKTNTARLSATGREIINNNKDNESNSSPKKHSSQQQPTKNSF